MNEPLTCIIVDDEPLAVSILEDFVRRTPFLLLTASYTDSVQALADLRSRPVDLLFLDIQMPDMDGMELSRMLPAETRVIFTTAFKEYAFESYEVSAVDFLLKPIRYNKFLQAAEKARDWFALRRQATAAAPVDSDRDHIFLRSDGSLRQVALSDIQYVEGLKDYVKFHLESETRPLITHLTMKTCEEMLPESDFMRVSRSYIVALRKIRRIDRNDCIYIADEIIHVTDSYTARFHDYIARRQL